jgi:hypothetical protein
VTCQYPTVEPWQGNPGGDCRQPATHAAPLGDTGRWLRLCAQHYPHRVDAVPLDQLPDP